MPRTDTERLDWFTKARPFVAHILGLTSRAAFRFEVSGRKGNREYVGEGKAFRVAIDRAMTQWERLPDE